MSKISCLLTDHAIKYDSGIDAGVLTHNFSSMSLDSSDSSYGSSAGDVLNRARMDSMDGDLSIKEELNRARILSQDFTLDGISLSADEDVSETRINVSIKLTNGKQVRNKENVVQSNKYAKLSKSDNKVECRQFVNKKQTNYRYGVINSTDPSPKAKPLSPSKNNCAPYNSPNNTSRAGPKKVNTRKKRTSRNSVSPPKRYQVVNNVTKALNKVSSCSPGLKTSNDTSGSKVTAKSFGANSKYSPVFASCPAKGKKSPYSKEDSIYSTPVQTPSKLHRLATPTLMSPNVTTRSSSPREKILNCKFITVRSTPSPTLPPPPPKKIFPSCSPPSSRTPSPTSSWYSAEDSSEFLPHDLSSSYCHSSPNANRSKLYFSPLFDDSAIVEASCSGTKYFNFPEAVNLENVWAQELQPVATEETNSSWNNVCSSHPVHREEASNNHQMPIMGHSLLGERLGRVLNVPVSPSCQSSDEQSYIDFQRFLDRLEGTTKVRKKKLSSSLDDSKSAKSSPTLSPLCCDCRLPDEMSEAELDEITWIHTTCNGQQVASRVFFGEESNDSFSVFPPPRSPRHLKWSEKLVQVEYDKLDSDKKTTRTSLKSILKKRPDYFVFPYNGDEPSPYLITRTRQVYSPV